MSVPNEDGTDICIGEALGPCEETCKNCGASAEWFDEGDGIFIGCSERYAENSDKIKCSWRFSGK